jgi:hypothetical protein
MIWFPLASKGINIWDIKCINTLAESKEFCLSSAATTSWRYCNCLLDSSLNELCRPVLATMASDIKNYGSVLGIKAGSEELNEHCALTVYGGVELFSTQLPLV